MSSDQAFSFTVTLAPEAAAAFAALFRPAPALPAANDSAGPLRSKAEAARALGVSSTTLDRFVREGAPVEHVGARRRFDLDALRTWLTRRGRKAASVVADSVDVSRVVARAGGRTRGQA